VGVASRWGSAAATLVPTAAGPLRLSARGGAARYGPVGRGLDVAGRPAMTRADGRAEIALPVLAGGALTVAPFVRGAAVGYSFDEAKDPAASAWGVGGAVVQTEVSRRFGAVRHAVAPRLEWRFGTGATGEALPFPAYDAFDPSTSTTALLSARPGPFQQLRAAVETRLEVRGSDLVRAELGQDVDLRAGRFAETFAALAVAAGPVGADARASFFGVESRPTPAKAPPIRSWLDDFAELRANLSLVDRRGDGVRAGFVAVGPGGSGTLLAGIDPLFDVRPADVDAGAAATAAFRATLGGARLEYEALLPGRAAFVQSCSGRPGELRQVGALQVQQHSGTLSWESSCRCFRINAFFRINDCAEYSYSASLDLTGLAGAIVR
jgi:LPS-assembly protein